MNRAVTSMVQARFIAPMPCGQMTGSCSGQAHRLGVNGSMPRSSRVRSQRLTRRAAHVDVIMTRGPPRS